MINVQKNFYVHAVIQNLERKLNSKFTGLVVKYLYATNVERNLEVMKPVTSMSKMFTKSLYYKKFFHKSLLHLKPATVQKREMHSVVQVIVVYGIEENNLYHS